MHQKFNIIKMNASYFTRAPTLKHTCNINATIELEDSFTTHFEYKANLFCNSAMTFIVLIKHGLYIYMCIIVANMFYQNRNCFAKGITCTQRVGREQVQGRINT